MKYTNEQQAIIDAIQKPENTLIKVDAVAGSGKTTLLQGIALVLNPKNGLYLAYNKAIALESKNKFPETVHCMTTHSLAYQNTIKPYGLSIGFFNYKDIRERAIFEEKIQIIETMTAWCLSKYPKFEVFKMEFGDKNPNISDHIFTIVEKYFNKMIKGQSNITHEGYLKLYHMLLFHKKIKHNMFDMVALDECGDLNEVTLEIFKLLPAKKKLMVGDKQQNIYTFNKTINGFKEMEGVGLQMHITQSFRCSEPVAKGIQEFCNTYIDKSMSFIGTSTPREPDNTKAIISRNNSTLIGEMIGLNKRNIKYNLTRKASVIFELVLVVLGLKVGGQIFSSQWRYIQEDVEEWGASYSLREEFRTPRSYIASLYSQDPAMKSALGIVEKYTPQEIYGAYNNAKEHELQKNHITTLSTCHSMKGLEFSTVYICNDLNESVTKTIEKYGNDPKKYDDSQLETMRLYYVAVSRCINKLENAHYINMGEL